MSRRVVIVPIVAIVAVVVFLSVFLSTTGY